MKGLVARILAYLESLRFPWLLLLTTVLFVASVFVPDAFPFVDEILLALITLVLGKLKRRAPPDPRD